MAHWPTRHMMYSKSKPIPITIFLFLFSGMYLSSPSGSIKMLWLTTLRVVSGRKLYLVSFYLLYFFFGGKKGVVYKVKNSKHFTKNKTKKNVPLGQKTCKFNINFLYKFKQNLTNSQVSTNYFVVKNVWDANALECT